jgi:hypothetical protein
MRELAILNAYLVVLVVAAIEPIAFAGLGFLLLPALIRIYKTLEEGVVNAN